MKQTIFGYAKSKNWLVTRKKWAVLSSTNVKSDLKPWSSFIFSRFLWIRTKVTRLQCQYPQTLSLTGFMKRKFSISCFFKQTSFKFCRAQWIWSKLTWLQCQYPQSLILTSWRDDFMTFRAKSALISACDVQFPPKYCLFSFQKSEKVHFGAVKASKATLPENQV